MFNIKAYLKFLSKNKLYTFVNVFGLSVSLMFVILIANYTISEFVVDSFQENADQIYVLSDEEMVGTAYKVGERLSSRYPEIEKTCGIVHYNISAHVIDKSENVNILAVDSTFLSMFSFKLLQGDRAQVLQTKQDILVSESFARKIFGDKDPIGNTIVVRDTIVYTINGVIEDFENSMFKPKDIIMRIENMSNFSSSIINDNMSDAGATTLFIQTVEGSNIISKESEVAEYFKTFFWIYKNNICEKVFFIPMRDMYFSERTQWHWNSNNGTMFTILVLVGLLVLLFAMINYINLTVAQTGFRAKEVATRRLFGASRNGIFIKMIFESFILCFVAFLIGYLFAFAVEPYASDLINKDIRLIENISASWVLLSILFVVLLGSVSGVIPAIAISRFQPIDVVKGTYTFKSKMTFSKIFITIQSVITIILIACSLTIYKQVDYLINYDYGYNHNSIIEVFTRSIAGNEEAYRDKLKQLPSVKNVGFTRGTPLSRGVNQTTKVVGVKKTMRFQVLTSDSATVQMLGFKFLKNNMLADSGVWVNQTTIDELGATDELKSFRTESGVEFKISGIVNEFIMGNLVMNGNHKTPLLLHIDDNLVSPRSVLVEIQGDLANGYSDTKRAFEEVSNGAEFQGAYISNQIELNYAPQRRIQKIMIMFSIIAIIISSLGLLAISSYFIQQRAKEIAIRKVFGSTRFEVLVLVIYKFIVLVIIAFFVASPIIWYLMNQWLLDFTYRIDMTIWILLTAGIFNLVVAFLTVYWQGRRVANADPTKVIIK